MLRALLPLALLLTAAAPGTARAEEARKPIQIRVKVEVAQLVGDPLAAAQAEYAKEVVSQRLVSGAQASRLRTNLAALVASGRAAVVESFSLTVLSGTGARIGPGPQERMPALRASINPTYQDGRIMARLDLSFGPGGDAAPLNAVHREVTVRENEHVAVRFAPAAPGGESRLVWLRFERVE